MFTVDVETVSRYGVPVVYCWVSSEFREELQISVSARKVRCTF